MTNIGFDQIRLDALKEISSIANGNAATSLSTMLGSRVNIAVPNIMMESLGKIPELLGKREKVVATVHFSVSGQVGGSMLLLFSPSESLELVNFLTGQNVTQIDSIDEMGLSALKELGNVVTGSFIRVLAEELKVRIAYSVPGFAHDMLGAILDEILARLSLETEYAIIMDSEFTVIEKIYQGHLIFILAPKALSAIIKALASWEKSDQTVIRSGNVRANQKP